ncbi:hypothetical protein COV82_05095 [Candidatus Peregrinibacteria bacterium CG11_big_fil_rev_8_21_14_0_20_46_8]|nr:MAG: hypothetical protein COV82_05095 [Candidatus Peregrinibacteria bacterium CG11_big_fil_rev_8_21_14_0_20_46_8]
MAKKTVPYVWVCQETKISQGSGSARPEKIREMEKMRYNPKLRKRTLHKAKAVKKGGTAKMANAK